jgi:ribosomal protein L24E
MTAFGCAFCPLVLANQPTGDVYVDGHLLLYRFCNERCDELYALQQGTN